LSSKGDAHRGQCEGDAWRHCAGEAREGELRVQWSVVLQMHQCDVTLWRSLWLPLLSLDREWKCSGSSRRHGWVLSRLCSLSSPEWSMSQILLFMRVFL